jgi:hypothetical protein
LKPYVGHKEGGSRKNDASGHAQASTAKPGRVEGSKLDESTGCSDD